MWFVCARDNTAAAFHETDSIREEMFNGYYGGFARFLFLHFDFLLQHIRLNGDRGSWNWCEESKAATSSVECVCVHLLSRS